MRIKAADAVTRCAPGSLELRDRLVSRLDNRQTPRAERLACAEQLRRLDTDAVAPLMRHLDDADVGPKAMESIYHLIDTHEDDAFAMALLPHVPAILGYGERFLAWDQPTLGEGLQSILVKHGDKLLPRLAEELRAKDPDTRRRAVQTLGRLADRLGVEGANPEVAERAVKLVLPLFKDRELGVREAVVDHVPVTDATRKYFFAMIFADDLPLALDAVARLGSVDLDAIPRLQEKKKAATLQERLRITMALWLWSSTPDLLQELEDTLRHKDPALRHQAAYFLIVQYRQRGEEGPAGFSKRAMTVLLESLKDANRGRRMEAASLMSTVQRHPEFLPALLDRLEDPSPQVRALLLDAVAAERYPGQPADVLKKLANHLEDKDAGIRLRRVQLLEPLGSHGLPYLVRAIEKDAAPTVREQACLQLAKLGVDAETAVPVLMRLAADKAPPPAVFAALAAIDHDGTFPRVLQLEEQRDDRLRKALAAYPKKTREDSTELVRGLLGAGDDADASRRREAAYALREILPLLPAKMQLDMARIGGRRMPAQLVVLSRELRAKSAEVRLAAALTLLELRRLDIALAEIAPALPVLDADEWQRRTDREARFQKAINIARVDPDVWVRRLARQADALEPPDARNARSWWLPSFQPEWRVRPTLRLGPAA